MEKSYKLLLVDDDKRYAEPLIERAYTECNFEIDYCEDWEEGKSKLIENLQLYSAIILDGKGKLRRDEKGDNPKHLSEALQDLKEMQGKGNYIPYVINTAYYDELSIYFGNENMNDKKDTSNLFKILNRIIKTGDYERIKTKYVEAFEPFDAGYLSPELLGNLIEVLLDFENNKWTENSFTPLRKIIESIYIGLHEFDDKLIPYACLRFDNEQVNFKFCELRMTGREIREQSSGKILLAKIDPVLPENIGVTIGSLTKICSISSHADKKKYITKYSLGIVINGVIDLLIWYKYFVDQNYK